MTQLFDVMQAPALVLWGVSVSWSEVLGDLSGGLCVWLVAREHIWNWPIGIVNNLFFCVLFHHAQLYGDAFLQVIFAVLGVYGWCNWLRAVTPGAALPIRRTTRGEWLMLASTAVVLTAMSASALAAFTDSPVPLWDASVLVLSLVATYGQANKLLESWWIWIAVDALSVPLYLTRSLYPTAALYGVFGLLCLFGLRGWTKAFRGQIDVPVAS